MVFVVTAIGTLIAAKIAVAVLAARFFPSLESRGYLLTMKLLAGTLVWFGLVSIVRAAKLGLMPAVSDLSLQRAGNELRFFPPLDAKR